MRVDRKINEITLTNRKITEIVRINYTRFNCLRMNGLVNINLFNRQQHDIIWGKKGMHSSLKKEI